jgi:CCR4-NOT transcription complex subunit 6
MAGPAAAGAQALVRVTSYNVLAQCYVRSAIFPHSPPGSLK